LEDKSGVIGPFEELARVQGIVTLTHRFPIHDDEEALKDIMVLHILFADDFLGRESEVVLLTGIPAILILIEAMVLPFLKQDEIIECLVVDLAKTDWYW